MNFCSNDGYPISSLKQLPPLSENAPSPRLLPVLTVDGSYHDYVPAGNSHMPVLETAASSLAFSPEGKLYNGEPPSLVGYPSSVNFSPTGMMPWVPYPRNHPATATPPRRPFVDYPLSVLTPFLSKLERSIPNTEASDNETTTSSSQHQGFLPSSPPSYNGFGLHLEASPSTLEHNASAIINTNRPLDTIPLRVLVQQLLSKSRTPPLPYTSSLANALAFNLDAVGSTTLMHPLSARKNLECTPSTPPNNIDAGGPSQQQSLSPSVETKTSNTCISDHAMDHKNKSSSGPKKRDLLDQPQSTGPSKKRKTSPEPPRQPSKKSRNIHQAVPAPVIATDSERLCTQGKRYDQTGFRDVVVPAKSTTLAHVPALPRSPSCSIPNTRGPSSSHLPVYHTSQNTKPKLPGQPSTKRGKQGDRYDRRGWRDDANSTTLDDATIRSLGAMFPIEDQWLFIPYSSSHYRD